MDVTFLLKSLHFACTSAIKIFLPNELQYKCELCKHSCILNISRGDYLCLGHAKFEIDTNRACTWEPLEMTFCSYLFCGIGSFCATSDDFTRQGISTGI